MALTISALPEIVNLALYAGDYFALDLEVIDAAGNPYDLSAAVATAEIRDNGSAQPMATFTATIDGSTIHLQLPSTEAANLAGNPAWDCQIADPEIFTLAAGQIAVTAQVTR